ncbi:hypothetical protein [uncultured Nostoc sp.]|uniref:hypothetical protein n=1 Tax=uncultured Nostoc sp. TaxID=340711 RepID=UPI0035CA7966
MAMHQNPSSIGREYKVDIKQTRNQVCDACRIFGALNLQGLIEFNDVKCENIGFNTGFMRLLYRPHPEPGSAYFDTRGKVAGRKFYIAAWESVIYKLVIYYTQIPKFTAFIDEICHLAHTHLLICVK